MPRISPKSLTRSPLFISGAVTVFMGALGLVISAATVVSLHFASPRIPSQLRQAFVPSLRAEGVAEQTIQNFIAGQVLSSNELARLPDPQAQALVAAQESSPGMVSVTQEALAISRQHFIVGIGVCTLVFGFGLVLVVKAIKRARLAEGVPD